MREGSYLDTSFLFKLYLAEPDSADAVLWFERNRSDVFVSPLSDIELTTSFLRRDSEVEARQALDNYREDLGLEVYSKADLDAEVFALATDVADRYSRQYKLRSLDILHLATALRYGIPAMGTYDTRLAVAAAAMGLRVLPERS